MAYTRRRNRTRVNVDISDELWRALMYKANILGYRTQLEREQARELAQEVMLQDIQNQADLERAKQQAKLMTEGQLTIAKDARTADEVKRQKEDEALAAATTGAGDIGKNLLEGRGGVPWNSNTIASFVRNIDPVERAYLFATRQPHMQKLASSAAAAQIAQSDLAKRRAEIDTSQAQDMADAALFEQRAKGIHNVGSSALVPSKYSNLYEAITGAQTGTKDVFADVGGLKLKVGEEQVQFPPSITKFNQPTTKGRTLVGKGPVGTESNIPPMIARPTTDQVAPPTIPPATPTNQTPPDVKPAKESGAKTEQDFKGLVPLGKDIISKSAEPFTGATKQLAGDVGGAVGSTAQNVKTALFGGKWAPFNFDKILDVLSKAGQSNSPLVPTNYKPVNTLQQPTSNMVDSDIAKQIQAQRLINAWSNMSEEEQDIPLLRKEKENQKQLLYSKQPRNTDYLEQPNFGLEYEDEERYRRNPYLFNY